MAAPLRLLAARLRNLFRREPPASDFDEDVELHLGLLTERFIERGMTPAEAATAARRQFGNTTLPQRSAARARHLSFDRASVADRAARRQAASAQPVVHGHRRHLPRARHRTHDRRFHAARPARAAPAAGGRTGAPGDDLVVGIQPGRHQGAARQLVSAVPGLPAAGRSVRERLLPLSHRRGPDHRHQHRAGAGRARLRQLLPGAARRIRPSDGCCQRTPTTASTAGIRSSSSAIGTGSIASPAIRTSSAERCWSTGSRWKSSASRTPGSTASTRRSRAADLAVGAHEGADDAGRKRVERSSLLLRSAVRAVEAWPDGRVGARVIAAALPPVPRRGRQGPWPCSEPRRSIAAEFLKRTVFVERAANGYSDMRQQVLAALCWC